MMKTKIIILAALMMLDRYSVNAHYMWIETACTGKPGKEHVVNVHFGEYTHGVVEKPGTEYFEAVKQFTLWVVFPSGEKTEIRTTTGEAYYQGAFMPTEEGTYTIVLNNNEIDVIDYTPYDFGIFKTHYHATAKVVIGDEVSQTEATNPEGLVVVDRSGRKPSPGSEVRLQVLYKNEPVKEAEVTVFVQDLWSKKLQTGDSGMITFSLPWKTKYVVEVTRKEEVPGSYKGREYAFIWHCATYCFDLK